MENEKANKYESFYMKKIERSLICGAEYNPRKITDSARKKLKGYLKSPSGGLLQPLTWNEQTGNLVSGHQRLSILDDLHNGRPYSLTVAVVNMSEQEEIKANIFMNNQEAQGEWDTDLLSQISSLGVDLTECGFDTSSLDVMGITSEAEEMLEAALGTERIKSGPSEDEIRDIRAAKKAGREKAKEEHERGTDYHHENADFTVTFVFRDNLDKRKFMSEINMPERDVRITGDFLWSLLRK